MKTVLIVDDERPARELLKMSLNWQELGFAPPEEASNGVQALEKYRAHLPDFVITDIQMPVMDGLEMIAEIRKIHPEQRIIILSCHESFSFAKQAIRLGVVDYLIKDELDPRALAEILLSPSADEAAGSGADDPEINVLEPLFTGRITWDTAAAALNSRLQKGQEYICCHVNGATVFSGQLRRIQQFIRSNGGGDLCRTESGDLSILLLCSTQVSRMADINEKNRLLWALRGVLEEGNAGPYTIGVSNSSKKGEDLAQCLREARTAARCSVFYGTGRTLYYDEQQSCMRESSLDRMNERLSQVLCAVDQGDRETTRRELTNLYRRDLPGMLQVNYLQHINISIRSFSLPSPAGVSSRRSLSSGYSVPRLCPHCRRTAPPQRKCCSGTYAGLRNIFARYPAATIIRSVPKWKRLFCTLMSIWIRTSALRSWPTILLSTRYIWPRSSKKSWAAA